MAADAAPAAEEAGEAPVTPRRLSSAEKFGNDATPDARKDQLNDRITPLKLMQEDDRAMLEDALKAMRPEDEMDARDAAAHRKKTAVWQLKQKRAARAGETSTEEFDRGATFDPLELERRLLRDRGEPGVVWTMGDDSLGQCGHAAERPDGVPYPAILGAKKLKGGVRSVHAGACCTLVVNEVGECYGFGSGPIRQAVNDEKERLVDASLTYPGAPPFRVLSADPQGVGNFLVSGVDIEAGELVRR